MNKTIEILKKLELNSKILNIYTNDTLVSNIDDEYTPASFWYPHPPCLVPMFMGNGPYYRGLLFHWFSDRKKVFVEFSSQWGYMLEEARTDRQFLTVLLYNLIQVEDELNNEITEIGLKLGFSIEEINQIYKFYEKYCGEIIPAFHKLGSFFGPLEVPITYCINEIEYKGDFPSSEKLLVERNLNTACGFEIANWDLLNRVDSIPEWLNQDLNKQEYFEKCINLKAFDKAWFALNSKGWNLKELANALIKLAELSGNSLFIGIAQNWIDGWKNSQFYSS